MKFYVIEATASGTLGCETTKKAALEKAFSMGYEKDEFTIECVDVNVNAETVRRLLGNLGGYANN